MDSSPINLTQSDNPYIEDIQLVIPKSIHTCEVHNMADDPMMYHPAYHVCLSRLVDSSFCRLWVSRWEQEWMQWAHPSEAADTPLTNEFSARLSYSYVTMVSDLGPLIGSLYISDTHLTFIPSPPSATRPTGPLLDLTTSHTQCPPLSVTVNNRSEGPACSSEPGQLATPYILSPRAIDNRPNHSEHTATTVHRHHKAKRRGPFEDPFLKALRERRRVSVTLPLHDIVGLTRCRYQLQPTAVEICVCTPTPTLHPHSYLCGSQAELQQGLYTHPTDIICSCKSPLPAATSTSSDTPAPQARTWYFFVLSSPAQRKLLLEDLLTSCAAVMMKRAQPRLPPSPSPILSLSSLLNTVAHPSLVLARSKLTELWVARAISNLDYLLALNRVAGRSYNDLNQYPVMPWVLAFFPPKDDKHAVRCNKCSACQSSRDTVGALGFAEMVNIIQSSSTHPLASLLFRDLSKPIGALTPERARSALQRYKDGSREVDSPFPPFHYGSHYSNMAIVLYYLFRLEPFASLHLEFQAGRYDVPDRLFSSIPGLWATIMNSSSCFKELIPEFYCNPLFLNNINAFPLGERQNGCAVNDVELPSWASNPTQFVFVNRLALESDYVSAHLHQWIDIMFGYQQRGPSAIDALNVYPHLSYEGAVDLTVIDDVVLKESYAEQIAHFGQTPLQLFVTPHPQRSAHVYSSNTHQPNQTPDSCLNQTNTADINASINLNMADGVGVDVTIPSRTNIPLPPLFICHEALDSGRLGVRTASKGPLSPTTLMMELEAAHRLTQDLVEQSERHNNNNSTATTIPANNSDANGRVEEEHLDATMSSALSLSFANGLVSPGGGMSDDLDTILSQPHVDVDGEHGDDDDEVRVFTSHRVAAVMTPDAHMNTKRANIKKANFSNMSPMIRGRSGSTGINVKALLTPSVKPNKSLEDHEQKELQLNLLKPDQSKQ